MTSLKKSGLLRTYYRDRLRGYRLGAKAKAALLDGWPERFSPYLTGDTDTNRLKSEVNRRLRLHRLAETYVTMDNAGIGLSSVCGATVWKTWASEPTSRALRKTLTGTTCRSAASRASMQER